MPLNPQALADGLVEISFKNTEPEVIEGWTKAWFQYFQVASAGVPIVAPALEAAPLGAFRASLAGMSVPGAGPLAIQNAITQFWAMLAAAPVTFFPLAIAIAPPPTLSGIAAAILAVAPVNVAGNVPAPAACLAVATAIHGCNLGGTATFPGPTPIITPII
jgi:hypothetical protein